MNKTNEQTGLVKKIRRTGGLVLSSLVVGALIGWAITTVFRVPDSPAKSSFVLAEVKSGEVGSAINLNVVAAWTPVAAAINRASGVVTTVDVASGDEISQGAVLYTVDLRPVVAAAGAVPAFRDIQPWMTGKDVAQLQSMLGALGLYRGPADGRVGGTTEAAIRSWQKSLGEKPTGVVGVGDVAFVPVLPTRVSLDRKIVFRGALLAGGEAAIQTLPTSPVFSLPVSQAQAGLIPTGTSVEVTSPKGNVWDAVATAQVQDPQTQNVSINLEGKDGAPVCGSNCNQIPVGGQAQLSAKVVTVETVRGLVVPSAALVTDANGKVRVITKSGESIVVVIKASAKGESVVTGLSQGIQVRVPGNG